MTQYYLWLDIETTGLDSNKDIILEVAAIVTDENHVSIESYKEVVLPLDFDAIGNMTSYVENMHTNNGLIEECYSSTKTIRDIDLELSSMLSTYKKTKDDVIYLAGSSIHFDRTFMKVHIPETDKLLHYRMLDVSAVILALPEVWEMVPESIKESRSEHRAMSDVLGSIDKMVAISKVIGNFFHKSVEHSGS